MKTRSTGVPAIFGALLGFFLLGLGGCGGGDSTSPVVETDPPTVAFDTPGADTEVSGAVVLAVSTTHTDQVRFFVDNQELGSDSSDPFSFSWNSGLVANGAHSLRARAEGAGGSTDAEIAILVNNAAGTVIVTVSPTEVSLQTGQTQQFAATVTGAASAGVTWSVDGGSGWGTISAAGLYTAPATVPNPATATVRATSVGSPGHSATAAVSLTGSGGGAGDQEEFLCLLAFGGVDEAVDLGEELLEWAVRGVWQASEQAGENRFYGTLTQTALGSEVFTYAATPTDRLVVSLVGGAPIEFTFTTFSGYVDGGWDDFLYSHNVEFRSRITGSLDLTVVSSISSVKDGSWSWARSYAGSIAYQGRMVQLDLTDSGQQTYETNMSSAIGETSQRTTGTASTAEIALTVDETFWSSLVHNSTAGTEVRNFYIGSKNSATLDGHTYQYVGSQSGTPAAVRWDTYTSFTSDPPMYNVVDDPGYWGRDGGVLKDGEVFGLLEFTSEILSGTWGPDLVLRTNSDGDYFLHTLISEP